MLYRRSVSVVMMAGSLLVAIVGASYAVGRSAAGTIHACESRHGGDLYVAKHCAKHDASVSWSKTGPRGPAGAPGKDGKAGAPGVAAAVSVHRGAFSIGGISPSSATVTMPTLPAGSYFIDAVSNIGSAAAYTYSTCVLTAGSSSDTQEVWAVPSNGNTVSWSLVTTLASATAPVLTCSIQADDSNTGGQNFVSTRITAIPMTSATSTDVGS